MACSVSSSPYKSGCGRRCSDAETSPHYRIPGVARKRPAKVTAVAAKLGVTLHQTLLVRLEPGCYVTEVDIVPETGKKPKLAITGRKRYLGLPLLWLYDDGELQAVLAHEPSEQTHSGRELMPIYRTIMGTLAYDRPIVGDAWQLSVFLANDMLRCAVQSFEPSLTDILTSRRQHIDEAAARLAGEAPLARALLKLVLATAC